MKVHAKVTIEDTNILLVESAGSGGGRYSTPVVLRMVKVPAGLTYMHVRQKGVEQVEAWDVDGRYTGPKSRYGRTLALMIADMEKIGTVERMGATTH